MPIPAGPGSPTLPSWAPTLSDVAKYVPHRTLSRSTSSVIDSQDTYVLTFDATTRPSSGLVERLIADGVAWVTAKAASLHADLYGAAAVCASLYSAAAVERGWPNDDSSLQRANDLEKRLDLLIADLVEANDTANDTGNYGIDVGVMWVECPTSL